MRSMAALRGILPDLGMRLPKSAIERLLDTWPVARLATLTPEGRPHQVPIVFARVHGLLWSPIDAKPKAPASSRACAICARARRRACCSTTTPRTGRGCGGCASTRRRAWSSRRRSRRIPTAAAAVAALRAKYPQYARVAVLRDPPVLLALRPLRTESWCAGRDAVPVC